jgi:hypothetical protein
VPAFSDITSCLAFMTVTSMSWRSLVLLGCFYCSTFGTVSIGRVGTNLIEWKTFCKIHLYTKQLESSYKKHSSVQPSGCTWRKRSCDRMPPSQTQYCEFLVFLGKMKDTMSIDNNTQNLHWQCFIIIIIIIISFLGILCHIQTQMGMNVTLH